MANNSMDNLELLRKRGMEGGGLSAGSTAGARVRDHSLPRAPTRGTLGFRRRSAPSTANATRIVLPATAAIASEIGIPGWGPWNHASPTSVRAAASPDAGGRFARHPGMHRLPGFSLVEAVVQNPLERLNKDIRRRRACPCRDRGGHLPQPGGNLASCGRGAGRTARRVGRSPSLPHLYADFAADALLASNILEAAA